MTRFIAIGTAALVALFAATSTAQAEPPQSYKVSLHDLLVFSISSTEPSEEVLNTYTYQTFKACAVPLITAANKDFTCTLSWPQAEVKVKLSDRDDLIAQAHEALEQAKDNATPLSSLGITSIAYACTISIETMEPGCAAIVNKE